MLSKSLCSYLLRQSWKIKNLRNCNRKAQCVQILIKTQKLHFYSTSTCKQPLKVKLQTETFQSILSPELLIVKKLFDENGHEIRVVGGAVRDLLMGKSADDLDLCTTATPPEMTEMFKKAGIRILSLSGIKHGTVFIRLNDKQNFEVTTLRIDVVTDGRRAVVKFVKDWRLDAQRRDLTVNSLFLDFDGYVHDYYNGIDDVKNRKLRFVDDPSTRIQEDYLRILRYFRFYGRIAECPNDHDGSILESIKNNVAGLDRVSGPRIWSELAKIILGRHSGDLLRTMHETNVTRHIGLPDDVNLDEFRQVCKDTEHNQPDVMTRAAALFSNKQQLDEFHARVYLSNKQYNLCEMILKHRDKVNVDDIDSITKHFSQVGTTSHHNLKLQMSELCKYKGNAVMAKTVSEHKFPVFPLQASKLSNKKGIRRKYTSDVLNFLRVKWVDSKYTLDEDQLLELTDEFIKESKDNNTLLYDNNNKRNK